MHGHESWHQQLPSAYQSMATNRSPCELSHAAQHSAGDAVQPTFSSSVDMHHPTPEPWFVVPAMSELKSEPPVVAVLVRVVVFIITGARRERRVARARRFQTLLVRVERRF